MRSFFFRFILKRKNRQGLLNIVLLGLLLSSFSLLVILGIMGGLQTNLKDRSKSVIGNHVVFLNLSNAKTINELGAYLKENTSAFRFEIEHEGLIQFGNIVLPVVLHGIFNDFNHGINGVGPFVPYEIVSRLGAFPGAKVEFYSPSYVDSFFDDRPRSFSFNLENPISTRVPELDSSHIWLSATKMHNFMRDIRLNRIRFFGELSKDEIKKLLVNFSLSSADFKIKSWDDLNTSLVWALMLEKIMMTFLFVGMCFLVCLSISSAILVFVKKVNADLTALWLLGSCRDQIFKSSKNSLILICGVSILAGIILGTLLLIGLDNFSGDIMPEVFVERKIPVNFNLAMYITSAIIPCLLSYIFVYVGLNDFKQETDFLKNVRTIGQV